LTLILIKAIFACLKLASTIIQEKDVRDVTIRNGKSRDTDIDIHKKKTLEIGQSRDTDIDIHKKKTLEM
jgi:hypothetical protein